MPHNLLTCKAAAAEHYRHLPQHPIPIPMLTTMDPLALLVASLLLCPSIASRRILIKGPVHGTLCAQAVCGHGACQGRPHVG